MAKTTTLPDWVGKDLVYFADGPRAGGWMFASHGPGSWAEQQRLAQVNGETPASGRTLGYVETDAKRQHRTGALGQVWTWQP